MKTSLSILLPFILLISFSGCGTMANLNGQKYAFISRGGQKPVRIFGGVRNDIDWIAEGVGFPESERQVDEVEGRPRIANLTENPIGLVFGLPIFGYFAVIDPALSFAGDVVTLPQVLEKIREQGDSWATPVADVEMPGLNQPTDG